MSIIETGLTTGNPLFKNCSNVKSYHCPGDTRQKLQPGSGWAFDSYAKTENITGEQTPGGGYNGFGAVYTKMSQITSASQTLVFMEEADPHGWNRGAWNVQWVTSAGPGQFIWNDAPAMYHGDVSTAALADGHAEYHKWRDKNIIAAGTKGATGQTVGSGWGPTSGPDYEYIRFRMRSPNWK
jgi:hypothetical protein